MDFLQVPSFLPRPKDMQIRSVYFSLFPHIAHSAAKGYSFSATLSGCMVKIMGRFPAVPWLLYTTVNNCFTLQMLNLSSVTGSGIMLTWKWSCEILWSCEAWGCSYPVFREDTVHPLGVGLFLDGHALLLQLPNASMFILICHLRHLEVHRSK